MNEELTNTKTPEEKLDMVVKTLLAKCIINGTITVVAGACTLRAFAAYSEAKTYQRSLVTVTTELKASKDRIKEKCEMFNDDVFKDLFNK